MSSNDFKIDRSHKTVVISLVKSHLDKQAAVRLRPNLNMNQDLSRGKGAGLVILLHGISRVGKTATYVSNSRYLLSSFALRLLCALMLAWSSLGS